MLKDDKEDESVKIGATRGLAAMGPSAKEALPTLREIVKDSRQEEQARQGGEGRPEGDRREEVTRECARISQSPPVATGGLSALIVALRRATSYPEPAMPLTAARSSRPRSPPDRAASHPPLALAADTPRSRPPKRAKPAAKKVAVVACDLLVPVARLPHRRPVPRRLHEGRRAPLPRLRRRESPTSSRCGKNDLSRELAKEHGFRVSDTIEDALTLGTGKLAVDGVLLICEHGDYPYNAKGQKLYPRHEYFQKIVEVFEKSGKTVPVFCDKHLSYDRKKAAEMVATAKKMSFPLMAGSSLPVTWRRPELEFKLGTKITEALVASRGELEIYGIHALEALQCMVERRFTGDRRVGSASRA